MPTQNHGTTMKTQYPLKALFSQIGMLITSSLELPVILDRIMHEIREYFEPQNWSLLRLDPNTNELFFMIAEGIDTGLMEDLRLRPGEGIAGKVAQTGQAIYVPDVTKSDLFSARVDAISGVTTRSIIAVPLNFRKRVYGVIELINTEEGPLFSDDDYLVLQTIADFAAIAFANAQMYEEAILIANHDPLTGLLNRNRLEEILGQYDSSDHPARRSMDIREQALTIVIDLDNFKEVNDRHGHQAGDRVLRHTAQSLRSCMRTEDLLFRIGGDEFLALVFIPAHGVEPETVREQFTRKLGICQCQDSREPFTVHLSWGMAYGPVTRLRALINEADQAMYHLKRSRKGI